MSATGVDTLTWSFGLINSAGHYLTIETFGNRINANGTSLKKKQIFTLEQDPSGKVFFRTANNTYLSTAADGKFTGGATSKGANEAFEIEAQADGRWALKGAHGYYAGGDAENIDAYTKVIGGDRLWIIQLAMHPQVCIRNVNRKTYVHLSEGVLNTDEVIPWGEDATITLVFFPEGKYGLQASNGKFLSGTKGALVDNASDDCKFIIEFFSAQIAFKASNGLYLTAIGAKGTVKATKERIGLDELFVLEDSHPQVKLKAYNGRRVSVRAGVEVSANQDDVTDAEYFQLEINPSTKLWSVRTHKNLLWVVGEDGSVHASANSAATAQSWFTIDFLGDKIAFKASNGKYLLTKKNGALSATAADANSESVYVWEIINRGNLILRGEQGFLGTMPSGVIECNKSTPEVYQMHITAGIAHISGSNGKYWKVNGDNITVNGTEPTPFTFEFSDLSKTLIKFGDKYLQGFQNGSFKATGAKSDGSTQWEY